MNRLTVEVASLSVQLWMLQLLLFAMGSFAVDGWIALLYAAMAWLASTPAFVFYPLLLRTLAFLQRPWLGLLLLPVALMAVNDWLFCGIAAASTTSTHYMSDTPPLYFSFGFREGEGLPIRLCVHGATVLSTVALWLPVTNYFRKQKALRSGSPTLARLLRRFL